MLVTSVLVEEAVSDLVRVPLDGGGAIVVRTGLGASASSEDHGPVIRSGPVQAGRAGDLMDDVVTATSSLREALEPVTQMSQQVLEQLGKARPRQVRVEFGVELTAQTGALLAKAGADCHLTVTLTWGADDDSVAADE